MRCLLVGVVALAGCGGAQKAPSGPVHGPSDEDLAAFCRETVRGMKVGYVSATGPDGPVEERPDPRPRCEEGEPWACHELEEHERARELAGPRCDTGDGTSCLLLGYYASADRPRAIEWFDRGCQASLAESCYEAGRFTSCTDRARARAYFGTACGLATADEREYFDCR